MKGGERGRQKKNRGNNTPATTERKCRAHGRNREEALEIKIKFYFHSNEFTFWCC
jgi:hypothetical protein